MVGAIRGMVARSRVGTKDRVGFEEDKGEEERLCDTRKIMHDVLRLCAIPKRYGGVAFSLVAGVDDSSGIWMRLRKSLWWWLKVTARLYPEAIQVIDDPLCGTDKRKCFLEREERKR